MHDSPSLALFFLFVFAAVVLPGMDMAFVMSNALLGGLRRGMTAVAGIVAGGLVHVAVAATGISVLLTVWPAGFNLLLVAGSLYMLWIGWKIAGSPVQSSTEGQPTAAPGQRVFRQAVITCLTNPKGYVFMLGVFPAFLHSEQRPASVQILWLAGIIALTQTGVYGSVAVAAARGRRLVEGHAALRRRMPRVLGPLLMGLSLLTLIFGWKPT